MGQGSDCQSSPTHSAPAEIKTLLNQLNVTSKPLAKQQAKNAEFLLTIDYWRVANQYLLANAILSWRNCPMNSSHRTHLCSTFNSQTKVNP